eukprot:364743-Chlamydomonas_euryale.AAC.44
MSSHMQPMCTCALAEQQTHQADTVTLLNTCKANHDHESTKQCNSAVTSPGAPKLDKYQGVQHICVPGHCQPQQRH